MLKLQFQVGGKTTSGYEKLRNEFDRFSSVIDRAVAHRSSWNLHGAVARGVKAGDDASSWQQRKARNMLQGVQNSFYIPESSSGMF